MEDAHVTASHSALTRNIQIIQKPTDNQECLPESKLRKCPQSKAGVWQKNGIYEDVSF